MSYALRGDQDAPKHTSRPAALNSSRLHTWLIGLALVSLFVYTAAPVAQADDKTNYTINFTTESVPGYVAPTSGSFTYDSTTPQFSNFFVKWDGITYNLTAAANAPFTDSSGCSGESSTAAYSFELLSQTLTGCPSGYVYDWRAEYITSTSPHETFFVFSIFTAPGKDQIGETLTPAPPGVLAAGQGDWTITPTAITPEPSTLLLLGTGLLCMGGYVRRRKEGHHLTTERNATCAYQFGDAVNS